MSKNILWLAAAVTGIVAVGATIRGDDKKPDPLAGWTHEFAAENGVSVSAMIEAMAIDWGERRNGDTYALPELDELARDARRIDAQRRRRARS